MLDIYYHRRPNDVITIQPLVYQGVFVMLTGTSHNGWNRVTSGLDVEVEHGVPVRITNSHAKNHLNERAITNQVQQLTGLSVSIDDWINITPGEQEWSLCIDKNEFAEVLRRLALASAALFVDRFHKPIGRNAIDWDNAEYNYDFNHAIEHCCIPYGTLNKDYYFDDYIQTMHEESARLFEEGISPLVEAEQ